MTEERKERLEACDVVGVPDFAGEASHVFEARSLFLLGSWMENAGAARSWPLHLACIGEPPDSVQWLAERAGAHVEVHEPVPTSAGTFINKARALEIASKTGQLLLVDLDVLVVGDPSRALDLGRCIAAAPVKEPFIPERLWRIIYPGLGLQVPEERISTVKGELGLEVPAMEHYDDRHADAVSMLPHYTGCVLWMPAECGLESCWVDHKDRIARIARSFEEPFDTWRQFTSSVETAFATCVHMLRARGVPFKRLPDAYCWRWDHLTCGAPRLRDAALFHALLFLQNMERGRGAVAKGIEKYFASRSKRVLPRYGRKASRFASSFLPFVPAVSDMRAVFRLVRRVYSDHVVVALKKSGRDGLL